MEATEQVLTVPEISCRLATAFPEIPETLLDEASKVFAAIFRPIASTLEANTFLDQATFDYLTRRIAIHHAGSSRPMKKENFEHAIEDAFRSTKHNVPPSNDPTRRGADVFIDGVGYSLKTFSSSSSNAGDSVPNKVDISKFAEARWIREPLSRQDWEKMVSATTGAIQSHLEEYAKIFLLHNHTALTSEAITIHYQLLEIPKSLFELGCGLSVDDMSEMYMTTLNQRKAKNPNEVKLPQTVSVRLFRNSKKVGTLSLDGSVEKIRFMDLAKSEMTSHASWKIELDAEAAIDQD